MSCNERTKYLNQKTHLELTISEFIYSQYDQRLHMWMCSGNLAIENIYNLNLTNLRSN